MYHNTNMKSTAEIVYTPIVIMAVTLIGTYAKTDCSTNITYNRNNNDNDDINSTNKLA